MTDMAPTLVTLAGREYVILPRDEYERLAGIPAGSVDAVEYTMSSIARTLRKAREHAGLSQNELAKKIRKSQAAVSSAEGGKMRVTDAYIKAVLKACKLPPDWAGG
jgi:ribosome-binding protein aMBF1 (putative translation factor)